MNIPRLDVMNLPHQFSSVQFSNVSSLRTAMLHLIGPVQVDRVGS
jgi:hypothetical protein